MSLLRLMDNLNGLIIFEHMSKGSFPKSVIFFFVLSDVVSKETLHHSVMSDRVGLLSGAALLRSNMMADSLANFRILCVFTCFVYTTLGCAHRGTH